MTYALAFSCSARQRRCALTAFALFCVVQSGHAQSPSADSADSGPPATSDTVQTAGSFVGKVQALDQHLFREVYGIDNAAFRSFVFISDATSYRAFYGSVPAALVYSTADGNGDWSDVYRLALSEVLTLGATLKLQKAFERDRPPHELAGTGIRVRPDDGDDVDSKTYSFPSGHAAVAAALVTSWSLSHPEWYVIAPGVIWASSVSVSRIWRGRHFPGDALGGLLLGGAVATIVHWLDPLITPEFLKSDKPASDSSPRFAVVIHID